jgi:hypothetical protein
VPERICTTVHLGYDHEAWIELMGSLGAFGNILLEVPLPKDCPPEWREIYAAADEAKRCLAKGGPEGWKGCGVAVRGALERWQEIEPAPAKGGSIDLKTRSKEERFAAIRWHVLQLAHLAAHSAAREWKREDAVAALAFLLGLLATRDP